MASTSDYIKSMYLDPKNEDEYLILKRKKKRKTVTDVRNLNIYDDDINLNEIKTNEDDEKYAPKEERPTIDQNIKDNSRLIKKLSSWNQIEIKNNESDDDYDLTNLRNKRNNKKQNNNDSDDDLNIRRKRDSSSDLEIDRRKKVSESSDSDLDIRNRRKTSPKNDLRERKRDYSNNRDRRHDLNIDKSRQEKRYDLNKEEIRKRDDYQRDRSRHRSKDRSSKRDLNEDFSRNHRIKKNRESIDESDKYHHHKRIKNKHSMESDDSRHHRHHKKSKRKSEDDSPKVIKINEIKNSSDEEDIREKIKNLYKEEGPDLEKLKEKNEIDQKYKQWSKGMKQINDRKKQLEEEEYEMSKPLARYKDDEDLDKHLRDQELIDDPMLEYFRKRKKEKDQQKQLEETGEVWIIPKYESKLPPPINRYNILPGYRWDGVDRGNGFELKLLSKKAEKKANEEEAYKYSTSDM